MSEILTTNKRTAAFAELGRFMRSDDHALQAHIASSAHYNAWFTEENVRKAVDSIAEMLKEGELEEWMDRYQVVSEPKKVGLILAGNIPLVGFHDILCVIASGNRAAIKLSSQDQKLIPFLLNKLSEIEPAIADQYEFVEKLTEYDAVIATGSNNSSRYFEYYFGRVPHIIRKNRNSIAILRGNESVEELKALGHDIFDYFGLGCRNVSKLYVPRGYDFARLFEPLESFKGLINHHKYQNNYDYNKSIMLVNGDPHLDNGFLLVRESSALASPLAVLYYEEYDDLRMLEKSLAERADEIQCTVGSGENDVTFGHTQKPKLWDYADGVDTMAFLTSIE